MTVRELIRELMAMPQDVEVRISVNLSDLAVGEVSVEEADGGDVVLLEAEDF